MLHQERELLKFARNILFTLRMEAVKEVKESDVGIAQLQIRNRKKSQLRYGRRIGVTFLLSVCCKPQVIDAITQTMVKGISHANEAVVNLTWGVCKTRTGYLRMADADGKMRMEKCGWKKMRITKKVRRKKREMRMAKKINK